MKGRSNLGSILSLSLFIKELEIVAPNQVYYVYQVKA